MVPDQNYERLIRRVTRFTLGFIVAWGFVIVLAQVRPFWLDEWRVIYNLKYKSFTSIFGTLDYMQQFPRVYLWLIKCFSCPFDYSYFTLRLPSYLVGVAVIFACYRLMNKLYPERNFNRFLFVLILVSSFTFTEYFVQIKQYTMDILLSLLAIYQLLELLSLHERERWNWRRYLLLCISFLVLPFFSYTYPLAIAPVYFVMLLQCIYLYKHKSRQAYRLLFLQIWLPLLLCMCSIVVFYITDVKQLMADAGMRQFWGHRLMREGFSFISFFTCTFELFANLGAGLIFTALLGITGVCALCYGVYKSASGIKERDGSTGAFIVCYSVVLIFIILILFGLGKFPLGETRLNAFTMPSICILIISLLDRLLVTNRHKLSRVLSIVLYVGVTGNIYTTFFASFTGASFNKKLTIYEATEDAIIIAQAKHMPIFITPDIAYPYEHTTNYPASDKIMGDWVLKTFPAYKVYKHTPVYAINSIAEINSKLQQMPSSVTAAIVGDGNSFRVIKR